MLLTIDDLVSHAQDMTTFQTDCQHCSEICPWTFAAWTLQQRKDTAELPEDNANYQLLWFSDILRCQHLHQCYLCTGDAVCAQVIACAARCEMMQRGVPLVVATPKHICPKCLG